MSDNQNFSCLNGHCEALCTLLISHVDELVKSFHQNNLLTESDVATIKKLDEQNAKVDHLMDIIIDKVEKDDERDYFDKLIDFMRDSQDPNLSNLAKQMSLNQQNVDFVPCVQPVMECEKQQLVTSTTPKFSQATSTNGAKSCDEQSETQRLLTSIIQREENRNGLLEICFSTVLCVGLPKTGKTSFCNLLMDKGTELVPSGDTQMIFIKKSSSSSPDKESKWKEISPEELTRIIDELSHYKANSLNVKKQGIKNDKEKWEVLLLLDYNVPLSALSLLQPSVVTFVTYKMLGRDFSFTNSDACTFIKSENKFTKFVKELLACSCIRRGSKFNELKISEECGDSRTSYMVFVGILNGSSSSECYEKEKNIINRSLHIVKKHINCSSREFPLSFWYVDRDTYLHLVNLAEEKEQSIENLRKGLDKEISQSIAHKLPITWILFYFMLCKLCSESKTSYASYNDVFQTLWKAGCKNYDEKELKLALQFFHNLGVLFYFDTVEGLKDYVFIDCTWIFEKLKYLLSDFEDSKHDYDAKEVLRHEGLLQSKLIKQIKFEGPGNMKLHTFVNLLKHLKYIAPLNQGDYFMPSKLEVCKDYLEIFKQYGSLQFKPLLVTFSSGSLHRSVFCFLAAYMMQTNKWEELKFKKQQHTFQDLIIFSIGVEQYVCIRDKIFFLEINLLSNAKSNFNWHYSLFNFIQHALDIVCHDLQLSSRDCKYGFLCRSCGDGVDNHMMVVEEYKDNCAYCCKINKTKQLSTNYTVWFERSNSLTAPVHGQATDSVAEEVERLPGRLTTGISNLKNGGDMLYEHDSQPINTTKVSSPGTERPQLKYLNRLRKDVSAHWHDLGVELLDDSHVGKLESITENNQKDVNKCCTKMFQLWLATKTSATWNDLLDGLKELELCDLATKIETALCKNPEQESHSNASTKPEEFSLRLHSSHDSTDGPENVKTKESSQGSSSESTVDTKSPKISSKPVLAKQNSIDCALTKEMFEHPSACKTDPLCTHDQKERSHDQKEKSHDQKEKSHDQKERSHDQKERSHDQKERPHDQKERSHDQREKSHDQKERSHDQKGRSHDQKERPNDQKERPHDQKERPHGLSEGATSAGGSLVLDDTTGHKKKQSTDAIDE